MVGDIGSQRCKSNLLLISRKEGLEYPVRVFAIYQIYSSSNNDIDTIWFGLSPSMTKPGQSFAFFRLSDALFGVAGAAASGCCSHLVLCVADRSTLLYGKVTLSF